MSDDLEHELRAALDDRARQAAPPHEAGPAVRRARRRRGLTLMAGALGAAAVVVVVALTAGALRSPGVGGPADPGTSVPPSPPPSTSVPTATPTNVPEAIQPEHGAMVWGLYLAVAGDLDDPAMEAARAEASALGYDAGGGELACDQPAAEELGAPADAFAVALYFATRADAEAAAALFDTTPEGIARVTTYCLD